MTVILYIDEFSRGEKQTVDAMLSILKKMGYNPIIFNGISGRTMLSMGMVRWARRVIARNISRLSKLPEADIIFLEPSAWSVYRDEAPNLLGASPVFSRCYLYDDWLLRHKEELHLQPFDLNPKTLVLLHEHCHQKSLNPVGLSIRLLSLIPGAEVIAVGETCCGMAGAFGYFRKNYDLSMQIGKPLFDEIQAHPEAIVSAPGISCQKQILDGTGRHVFHPVELIDKSFRS